MNCLGIYLHCSDSGRRQSWVIDYSESPKCVFKFSGGRAPKYRLVGGARLS